jgi:predicted ArsR family transcriptional regulator
MKPKRTISYRLSEQIRRVLREHGEMTAQQIAEHMHMSVGSTLYCLRLIHKKNLVYQPRKLYWAFNEPMPPPMV